MGFNSQICTTKEQSERLLALGLKKETADMMYCKTASGELITAKDDDYLEHLDFPAWSLHRLIEVADTYIEKNKWHINYDNIGFEGLVKTYETELIDALYDMAVKLKEEEVI